MDKTKHFCILVKSGLIRNSTVIFCNVLFILVATSCLISCSEEVLRAYSPEDGPTEDCSNNPWNMTVKINTGDFGETRADSFSGDNDLDNETGIAPGNHHFLLLYDGSDSGKPVVFTLSLPPGENRNTYEKDFTTTLNVSSIYVGNELRNFNSTEELKGFLKGNHGGVDKEAYVILNINPEDFKEKGGIGSYTLNELKEKTLKGYGIKTDDLGNLNDKGKEYFSMSNSVFFSSSGVVKTGAGIDYDNIFDSPEEAAGKPAVTVYVERMAVKYTVGFAREVLNGNKLQVNLYNEEGGFVPAEATVKVIGFGVSCLEKDGFLFKNIGDCSTDYFKGWNKPEDFHCFWAEDPHYTLEKSSSKAPAGYPHQFRNAFDTDTVASFNAGCYLHYKSFEDILNEGNREGLPFYSMENTYFDPGMKGEDWVWQWEKAPFSVATHLLVLCCLEIERYGNKETLYRRQNNVFYTESELLTEALETVCRLNDGAKLWIASSATSGERVATKEDLRFVPAEISGGDGQAFIAPIKEDGFKYYLAPAEDDGSSGLMDKDNSTEISFSELATMFRKTFGPVDVFKDGNMYYAIPISHNETEFTEDSWKRLGNIGVVRNNWYDITITEIKSIGTPVHESSQPIIPVMDRRMNLLNAEVTVSGWDKVPVDVELNGKEEGSEQPAASVELDVEKTSVVLYGNTPTYFWCKCNMEIGLEFPKYEGIDVYVGSVREEAVYDDITEYTVSVAINPEVYGQTGIDKNTFNYFHIVAGNLKKKIDVIFQ